MTVDAARLLVLAWVLACEAGIVFARRDEPHLDAFNALACTIALALAAMLFGRALPTTDEDVIVLAVTTVGLGVDLLRAIRARRSRIIPRP